jgi:hypothetical protein
MVQVQGHGHPGGLGQVAEARGQGLKGRPSQVRGHAEDHRQAQGLGPL